MRLKPSDSTALELQYNDSQSIRLSRGKTNLHRATITSDYSRMRIRVCRASYRISDNAVNHVTQARTRPNQGGDDSCPGNDDHGRSRGLLSCRSLALAMSCPLYTRAEYQAEREGQAVGAECGSTAARVLAALTGKAREKGPAEQPAAGLPK